MKKSRFSEEQITYALRQADSGTPVADICRQLGVSEASFYHWRKKFGNLGISGMREMRQLREENARLKRLVADLTLRQTYSRRSAAKKSLRPARRRMLACWIRGQFDISVLRACRLAQFSRAAYYRRSTMRDSTGLQLRIRDIAHARPRFGYRRITVLLRREGWHVNYKRVHRLYQLEGLQVRMRVRRRKHMCLHRGVVPRATRAIERWSMDFVHDQLFDGRPVRVLTVVDQFTRLSPVVEPRFSFKGCDVVATLDRVTRPGRAPLSITVDHGPEFISRAKTGRGVIT
jgi:putative transposase